MASRIQRVGAAPKPIRTAEQAPSLAAIVRTLQADPTKLDQLMQIFSLVHREG